MTPEIALTLAVLLLTIVLFVTEVLRTDVVALLVMLLLPSLGLIPPSKAFQGFSSAAVISIMGVIVMGHGLDRTGITTELARPIARIAAGRPRRLLVALLGSVGLLSAFIQNVGAAALFLPVSIRLGKQGTLRAPQLIMPVGFAAILGGTLTMIGSSPLIILNDLVEGQGEAPFGLFSVTPIGLALLGSGIALFALFGTRLLPERESQDEDAPSADVLRPWSVLDHIEEAMVELDSPLIGLTRQNARLIDRFGVHVLAVRELGRTTLTPSASMLFAPRQRLALLGEPEDIRRMTRDCGLRPRPRRRLVQPEQTLYAEVLVPPGSAFVGKTVREVGLRRSFGVEPLAILSGGEQHLREFADRPIRAGDMMLLHGHQKRLRRLRSERNLVVLTRFGDQVADRTKGWLATICFLAAITAALAGVALPIALLSGALAMVLLRVMSMDDAYRAISWRTVFLLAGLIPLGQAMQSSGAAEYLAGHLFGLLEGAPTLLILFALAALTTLFTLFMSNVAATVVLVPLAMGLARLADLDPRALALLVAVCAQNSFLLPTHQVNALLMTAGGYRNTDYLRAGGLMTLLFLLVVVAGITLIF